MVGEEGMSTTDEQRLREAILRILKHHAIPRDGVLESDLIYAALAQQAPTPAVLPECAASGGGCEYGSHGPNGAQQCRYCGEPAAPAGEKS